jgi:MFS family permease
MMVGNYYCYDNPAALHTQLEQWVGKPSNYGKSFIIIIIIIIIILLLETLFSLLYTVYSIPNCFLPFFGGYFVDRLGVRMCLAIFVAFITIGQIVFALGVSLKSWPVMFLGRVIYGFGGESLVLENIYIILFMNIF